VQYLNVKMIKLDTFYFKIDIKKLNVEDL